MQTKAEKTKFNRVIRRSRRVSVQIDVQMNFEPVYGNSGHMIDGNRKGKDLHHKHIGTHCFAWASLDMMNESSYRESIESEKKEKKTKKRLDKRQRIRLTKGEMFKTI